MELVYEHLSNLATVNADKPQNEKIYCTNHLPREMQRQRKALLPKLRKAKTEEKDAKFQIDYKTGNYNLYVDNELVPMPKSTRKLGPSSV